MLNLSNAITDRELKIAARHVVAIQKDPDGSPATAILTSTGVLYLVNETVEEIGRQPAWGRI